MSDKELENNQDTNQLSEAEAWEEQYNTAVKLLGHAHVRNYTLQSELETANYEFGCDDKLRDVFRKQIDDLAEIVKEKEAEIADLKKDAKIAEASQADYRDHISELKEKLKNSARTCKSLNDENQELRRERAGLKISLKKLENFSENKDCTFEKALKELNEKLVNADKIIFKQNDTIKDLTDARARATEAYQLAKHIITTMKNRVSFLDKLVGKDVSKDILRKHIIMTFETEEEMEKVLEAH